MIEDKSKKNEKDNNAAKNGGTQKKETKKNCTGRKKVLITSMAAFLLFGGVMFLIMIFIGTKDIKDQDARMNFSFGNVIAGAVAPIFDALGISTENEKMKSMLEAVAEHNMARFRQLDLSDWLASSDQPSGYAAKNGGGRGANFSSSGSGNQNNDGSDAEYYHADFGFSGGIQGGGGSSDSSSSRNNFGNNSFSQSSAKDVFASDKANSGQGKGLPPMKGKNALNAVKASRDMLKNALGSGSAVVAKSEWSSAFGQGQSFSHGKSSGFKNGKKDLNVFKDSNAVALDKIDNTVKNLKGLSDFQNASIPQASVPETLEEDEEVSKAREKKKQNQSENDLFLSIQNAKPVSDSESDSGKSGKTSEEKVPKDLETYAKTKAPDGPWQNKAQEIGCATAEVPECELTYKESKPKFSKTADGEWVVTYKGTANTKYTDKDGNKSKEKINITTTYTVKPGSKPPEFSSCCVQAEGKTSGVAFACSSM